MLTAAGCRFAPSAAAQLDRAAARALQLEELLVRSFELHHKLLVFDLELVEVDVPGLR